MVAADAVREGNGRWLSALVVHWLCAHKKWKSEISTKEDGEGAL